MWPVQSIGLLGAAHLVYRLCPWNLGRDWKVPSVLMASTETCGNVVDFRACWMRSTWPASSSEGQHQVQCAVKPADRGLGR